jgi:hypothetical protein
MAVLESSVYLLGQCETVEVLLRKFHEDHRFRRAEAKDYADDAPTEITKLLD